MKRRVLCAMALAGIVASVLRLGGGVTATPQPGRWRELTGPELRSS